MLNVILFEMRAERNSCARNITLDWIGLLMPHDYKVFLLTYLLIASVITCYYVTNVYVFKKT